ncbi:saccharopine dehydrogenase NADP-binding domain-containing protein [bacterium]|nr:saccharopine dehydrogenase NADP-binding domain-containing protein [bacterium]MBU1073443.1 saccharopine dehydrogenase NADP-binding domain-containing protein [bacterium]MBU1675505.1 saccharopine dehydrogenase NADP-binding domain-containing protein [bacterium]
MKKICVLGAGLVGGPMALDLAADEGFEVTVADRDEATLAQLAARAPLRTALRDLSDPAAVGELAAASDLVLEAMPGRLGFHTLRTVIESGRDVVSISFFAEDPFDLDELARARGVTALVDCGVFPGMGSALIMDAVTRRLDRADAVTVLVGGLPEHPRPPLYYRSVFSPADVIEEYVRPARHLENGVVVVRPALSDVEPVYFEDVGDLECFSTDGLRTLLRTIPCPDIREKTLRLTGTAAQMGLLRDLGLFDEDPVRIEGRDVRPRDMALALLGPLWRMPGGEGDLTVMRIEVAGETDGAPRTVRWDLIDHWDRDAGVPSMARTTGYTATAAVRMVADGTYTRAGISPPEYLGREKSHVDRLLRDLGERGVVYREAGAP